MKLSQPAFAANTSITYVKNVKKKRKGGGAKKHTNNKETKQKQKINKRSQG